MKKIEINYYDEFIKNIDICFEISNILKKYNDSFKNDYAKEIEKQVHKLENDADLNLHNIKNYLVKDFLPPIDREDIVLLVNKIDDVVDNLDEIIIDLNIFNIKELREDFKEYTELIYKICLKLKEMMSNFKDLKKYEQTKSIVIEINHIEELGDRLFEKSIKNLYNNETNPIEVLKWHTIYECIENCIDSCEGVADCVEEILMKNS